MDTLIMKIMNFAQRLVDADRASLFLVDSRNKELYARIFDIGITSEGAESSKSGGSVSYSQEAIAKLEGCREIRSAVPCFSDRIKYTNNKRGQTKVMI
jgi:hypothetical protein